MTSSKSFFDQLAITIVDTTQEPVVGGMHYDLKKDLEIARLHKRVHAAKQLIKQLSQNSDDELVKIAANKWLTEI